MFIFNTWVVVLMIIAFVFGIIYIVQSIYVHSKYKKMTNELRKMIDDLNEQIENEAKTQLISSLLSSIDYTKGTRKPKKGEKI